MLFEKNKAIVPKKRIFSFKPAKLYRETGAK